MGALHWQRPEGAEGVEGGDEASGGGMEALVPVADPSLVLVVAIAAATSMAEVVGAVSTQMGGAAPPATWQLVGQACSAALAELPADEAVEEAAVRVALGARRELLKAAAERASKGEALSVNDAAGGAVMEDEQFV